MSLHHGSLHGARIGFRPIVDETKGGIQPGDPGYDDIIKRIQAAIGIGFDVCQHCGVSIGKNRNGRPRRFCSVECSNAGQFRADLYLGD